MGKLDSRIAIVTGAAGGLGKAIALLFAREGADIAIVDQIPRTPSGKADLNAVREFFSHPVEHVQ